MTWWQKGGLWTTTKVNGSERTEYNKLPWLSSKMRTYVYVRVLFLFLSTAFICVLGQFILRYERSMNEWAYGYRTYGIVTRGSGRKKAILNKVFAQHACMEWSRSVGLKKYVFKIYTFGWELILKLLFMFLRKLKCNVMNNCV